MSERIYRVFKLPAGLQRASEHRTTINRDARAAGHPRGGRGVSEPRTSADGAHVILNGAVPAGWQLVAGPFDAAGIRAYLAEHEREWELADDEITERV